MKRDNGRLWKALVPFVVSLLMGGVLIVSLAGCLAAGPTYPSKAITYIVPSAQGAGTDVEVRALLDATLAGWPRVSFDTKNFEAGGGTAGAVEVMKAKPDGYTVGMIMLMPLTMQPWLMGDKLPYKSPEEFIVVNQLYARTTTLVVKSDSKYNSLKDLIDDFKSGKRTAPFTYAGRGVGNAEHLTMEMVRKAAGLPDGLLKVVPYASDAEGVAAVLGGHIEASNFMWATHKQLVASGQLKVLFSVMPFPGMEQWGIKTAKDFGYDITFSPRHYTIMPKGTPKEIVATVDEAFKKGLNSKTFTDYMDKVGDFPLYANQTDATAYVMSQYQLQGQMAKELGLVK